MFFKKLNLFLTLFLILPGFVFAELQTWNLADGTTFEAELVATFPTEVSFRNAKGKNMKISLDRFSEKSLLRIELENPPKLSFDLIKDCTTKNFPMGINEGTQRPSEVRCYFGVRIKQTSSHAYDHELHVELFILGKERLGGKLILLDKQNTAFFLTKENRRKFELKSEREVVFRDFGTGEGKRGEKYYGYLVVVKDERGETITVNVSHNWLSENLENLKERYVGNYMDTTCTRVFPTRPRYKR